MPIGQVWARPQESDEMLQKIFQREEAAVLYVTVLGWKPGVTAEQITESLSRRAQWQYPEGIRVLGEYLAAGPRDRRRGYL